MVEEGDDRRSTNHRSRPLAFDLHKRKLVRERPTLHYFEKLSLSQRVKTPVNYGAALSMDLVLGASGCLVGEGFFGARAWDGMGWRALASWREQRISFGAVELY